MDATWDGIILGTGHNSLVLQAYLCRSGLRVLSLDRAQSPGGALRTVENPRNPGFLHNTHSFFHRGVTALPWYADLDLERHGASYLEPDPNAVLVIADGRSLEWWGSLDRTVESVARFSEKDASAWRRWVEEFRPLVDEVIAPEARSPPLPPARRRAILERSAKGRRFLEVAALSPLEFVERGFENDTVRAALLFLNGLREVDLRLRGFGHAIPALLAARHRAQMCVGGSARLAEALIRDVREHGGEVRAGEEPAAILYRRGRAVGVETSGGERLGATSFVASGLNPQQTFLDLFPADAVSREVREAARSFRYNVLAPLFGLHVALREPPRFRGDSGRRSPFMYIIGLERLSQFRDMVAAHEKGELPPELAWGACPTLFDPLQAPAGKHAAFLWQKVPWALRGDPLSWEREKDAHGARLLELWERYAPGLVDSVIDSFVRTPLDTARSFPNMRRGDLLVGSFAGGQVGYHRPFAGAGEYRGVIPGLYLCGSCCHPGGNTTGLCGYNAASVIAADLGLDRWWNPPDVEEAWKRLG